MRLTIKNKTIWDRQTRYCIL